MSMALKNSPASSFRERNMRIKILSSHAQIKQLLDIIQGMKK